MRKLAATTVLLAVLVGACAPLGAHVFETSLFSVDATTGAVSLPLPVAFGDDTNLVVGVEPADPTVFRAQPLAVVNDPANPNSFVVAWLGGTCDRNAEISFAPIETGFHVHLQINEKLGLGCPAATVPRALRVRTSAPVDVDAISTSGGL